MKLTISHLHLPIEVVACNDKAALKTQIAKQTGIESASIGEIEIMKRSIDARRKDNVHYVITLAVDVDDSTDVSKLRLSRGVQVKPYEPYPKIEIPDAAALSESGSFSRPLIVGAGPAGLFAALYLAKAGLRPVIIERGKKVEDRANDIQDFINTRKLNPHSNIQFGEGGAGTFSDGKLNTGTKSPFARFVLESFVDAGAPKDILIDAKPHVGTDYLKVVVANLRERIIDDGGEFRFEEQLIDIVENADGSVIATVKRLVDDSRYCMTTDALILAIGHSARDTYEMLNEKGFALERKPFAVGVRIEHAQSAINKAQYGRFAKMLPAADYKLSHHTKDGRGVYTFCNCPGGVVVAAASEEGGVCVNGMSDHARDGKNANSALLVEVKPSDFPESEGVLAAMYFQRDIERKAFDVAGADYSAPAQSVGSYLAEVKDARHSKHQKGTVFPTYPLGTEECDLHDVLPAFVADALTEALPALGKRLKGFDDPNAVMTAVEARSSSPVRIVRDAQTLRSLSMQSVYPAGEGAGYAGGIMSAACDGLRIAQNIVADRLMRQQIDTCADSLMKGDAVIFPTDTVFGIGVSVEQSESPQAIYEAKGRKEDKPIAWLVSSIDDLDTYGCDIPDYAHALAERYWPGALTLVVKAADGVPDAFASNDRTIGLRMPNSEYALALMDAVSSPLATSSANASGGKDACDFDDLDHEWVRRTGCEILQPPALTTSQHGRFKEALPSTVVDCTGDVPRILRHGAIPEADILET